jgi:hypothetical protein
LTEREDAINSIVLQSNGRPSAAYTFADFMAGLEVAVYQLPMNKAFFVGEGAPGRLPRLSGAEYGLVNIAAFLANAMEEGIRIDSCDEWNTDFMFDGLREKYPLSNSCGQHGRSYQDEECQPNEPFQCAANNAMQLSAVYGNSVQGIPPFMCAARIFDGREEIFPGYYDSVEKRVIPSAYSNTLGRTDIEGCCWWGRGALLTRGRCITGKLDKFIGQGAVERGVYVYPDINFCSNPEAICNDRRTNELRWVLGMLEWSDRVQSYSNIDGGWTYVNELKRFVDGGMIDETFFDGVINILKRNCHDDSCPNRWVLDEENDVLQSNRRINFRRIIYEVFNLPMTYRPTTMPNNAPTWSPTLSPTASHQPTGTPTKTPTPRPTRPPKKAKVIRVPSNDERNSRAWNRLTLLLMLFIQNLASWAWSYLV